MEPIITVIAFVILLIYAGLLLYYRKSWVSILDFKPTISHLKAITKISVIIPARNEAHSIGKCLQSIANQSYPKELFEVLVINDHSTDNTAAVVESFDLSNLKLLNLQDLVAAVAINSYKKKAIEIAIRHSEGELIITTDADCIVPSGWLQTIAAFYEEKKPAFIAMPVVVDCSNTFIEIFQALDFMSLQGITGASVQKKIHSMCNGANLAYTKTAFIAVNGFAGIDSIASGDDMLLMHKIFKLDPAAVLFLKAKEVIVQTQPVNSIKDFFNQRIRWASKAGQYDDKRIFTVLLVVYLFNLLLLLLPIMALVNNKTFSMHIYPLTVIATPFGWWLFFLIMKTVIELIFLFPVAEFFKKRKLLWWFPLMQPFHILYTVIAGWLGKFGSYKWKGRNVK